MSYVKDVVRPMIRARGEAEVWGTWLIKTPNGRVTVEGPWYGMALQIWLDLHDRCGPAIAYRLDPPEAV